MAAANEAPDAERTEPRAMTWTGAITPSAAEIHRGPAQKRGKVSAELSVYTCATRGLHVYRQNKARHDTQRERADIPGRARGLRADTESGWTPGAVIVGRDWGGERASTRPREEGVADKIAPKRKPFRAHASSAFLEGGKGWNPRRDPRSPRCFVYILA